MKQGKRGRPRLAVEQRRNEPLLVRLDSTEKTAFKNAADLAGVPLSAWVRERLRQIAARELASANRPIAFLRKR